MDKPEALRLAEPQDAELRRLHEENAALAAALASSCDEQRHELWESGGVAGCERARVAERQRDALLEALKMMTAHYCNLVNSGDAGNWEPDAEPEVQIARAAIKAVEETK